MDKKCSLEIRGIDDNENEQNLYEAERDIRKLMRETDRILESQVLKSFENYVDMTNWKNRLINKFKGMFGANLLLGNKEND